MSVVTNKVQGRAIEKSVITKVSERKIYLLAIILAFIDSSF